MTPEQEIERIKKDYKEHWPRLENHPTVQWAISNNDPVRLGEIVAMLVHGNYYDQGAAHQSTHPVVVFINSEVKDFDTVESARIYIAHLRKLNPAIRVEGIFERTKDGVNLIPE